MKKLIIILLLTLTSKIYSAEMIDPYKNYLKSIISVNSEQDKTITIQGVIQLKGDTWVIHGTDVRTNEVKDYYPSNLTREFKVEGVRVQVNASVDPIPENARLAGTPITIISIEKI